MAGVNFGKMGIGGEIGVNNGGTGINGIVVDEVVVIDEGAEVKTFSNGKHAAVGGRHADVGGTTNEGIVSSIVVCVPTCEINS